MVRVIQPPEDATAGIVFKQTQKTPLFLSDAGERLLKPKDLENKGLTRPAEHIIMYRWNAFSCGYFSDSWGFDEEYPSFLRGHVDEEEWSEIIGTLNLGFVCNRLWPKLAWVPFFLCCFLGAICEGAAYSNDRMPAPGVVFAVWVLVGFLVSVIYLVVMREIVKGDLSRIDSLCLVFSNRFRKDQRGVVLSVKRPSPKKAPHLYALAVQYHVPEANIAVHTFNPEDEFGRSDLHTVQVEEWADHSRLVVSDRFHPAADLGVRPDGSLPVFEYGKGTRFIAPPAKKTARRVEDEQAVEDVEDEEVEEEQPFGWCDCELSFEAAPTAPVVGAGGAQSVPMRASAVVHFHGTTYTPCPVCKRMRGRLRRTKEAGGQGAKGWAPYKPTISTGALAERAEKAVAAARVSIAQHRGY